MKFKLISIAVATLCLSQSVLAQVKTLDFYSNSGSNRYSILGKIKELNLPTENNHVLITNANSNAYVKLNNNSPFMVRFIENDLNLHQMIESNKGQMISHNGKNVKLIGLSGDKLIVEQDNKISFIPLVEVSFPKTLLNDAQKGLKVSFSENVKPEDTLYFSQPERQLSYNNTYEAVLNKDSVTIAHYLNVMNNSSKTFDNVFLNFFLSETNVREIGHRKAMVASAMVRSEMMRMSNDMAADEAPSFDENQVQNLKSIKIQKPMTLNPNLNKIKYTDKAYSVEQYVVFALTTNHVVYLEGLQDKKVENTVLVKKVEDIKAQIKSHEMNLKNMIEIKVDKKDILPAGKFDLYENVDGQDKLIVSSNISHTENEPIKLFKSKNNDLKISNVVMKENKELRRIDSKSKPEIMWLTYRVESLDIKNESNKEYVINIFDKKIKIAPNALVKITSDLK